MMPFDPSKRSQLKTGVRPGLIRQQVGTVSPSATPSSVPAGRPSAANAITASRHERAFKRGSLMFIEGEPGDEMFIVKTGKIKVLKQEGGKTIELATLGPGSVIGEMSLLIDMPRAATAQVLEDTAAIAINRTVLEDTYTKIPSWFVTVIKVLVGRLHDTLKRNTDNIVRDHIGGVAHVILLLLQSRSTRTQTGNFLVRFSTIKEEVLSVIGLSGADTDKIVTELILKELLIIRKGDRGEEFVEILKPDILQLFFEYKFGKSNGKPLAGESMTEKGVLFAKNLLSIGKEKGLRQKDGYITLSRSVAEIEFDRRGAGHHLDLDAIDELTALKLIELIESATTTQHLVHKQYTFKFHERRMERALLLREWMGAFSDAD